jgi:hypothetical protein
MKPLIITKTSFDSLPAGVIGNVVVSSNGKSGTKLLKLTKLNSRSILFIEVDKVNRINTFRKFKVKDILELGYDVNNTVTYIIKDGVLPDKWESPWDSISLNPVKMSPWVRQHGTFSKHSRGWAPTLPSTTNSSAGFPIV